MHHIQKSIIYYYLNSEPIKELAASLFGEMIGATVFLIFTLICFVKET